MSASASSAPRDGPTSPFSHGSWRADPLAR
jgi:hypothetical protein